MNEKSNLKSAADHIDLAVDLVDESDEGSTGIRMFGIGLLLVARVVLRLAVSEQKTEDDGE
jgi:hypothetical protein